MNTDPNLKSRLVMLLDNLPETGQEELGQFLDFLTYKYQRPSSDAKGVALGGLWEASPLGVTEAEIRRLRQASDDHLLDELEDGLSS